MDEIVLVYTTWPDAETAQAAAEEAIGARLAACANILAPMRSIYRWAGDIQRQAETPMILKTRMSCAPALRSLLLSRHPYDVPCVAAVALHQNASNTEFLAWIEEETRPPSQVQVNKPV
jgi:periplasmic divalent cation tolerance protein